MNQFNTGITLAKAPNVVDRASDSADRALEATRRLSDTAIDGVAGKVHEIRDRVSPVVDRMVAPLDDVVRYTRQTPVRALLISAAVGAALMTIVSWLSSDR